MTVHADKMCPGTVENFIHTHTHAHTTTTLTPTVNSATKQSQK